MKPLPGSISRKSYPWIKQILVSSGFLRISFVTWLPPGSISQKSSPQYSTFFRIERILRISFVMEPLRFLVVIFKIVFIVIWYSAFLYRADFCRFFSWWNRCLVVIFKNQPKSRLIQHILASSALLSISFVRSQLSGRNTQKSMLILGCACSVLQCVAVCVAEYCRVLQCVAAYYSVLQKQCVAVCCSVLQGVAVRYIKSQRRC